MATGGGEGVKDPLLDLSPAPNKPPNNDRFLGFTATSVGSDSICGIPIAAFTSAWILLRSSSISSSSSLLCFCRSISFKRCFSLSSSLTLPLFVTDELRDAELPCLSFKDSISSSFSNISCFASSLARMTASFSSIKSSIFARASSKAFSCLSFSLAAIRASMRESCASVIPIFVISRASWVIFRAASACSARSRASSSASFSSSSASTDFSLCSIKAF